MPPKSSQKRAASTEKPKTVQGKQLKSGVEVWYPPNLYGNKSTSSTAPGTPSSVASKSVKVVQRTTRGASSGSSSGIQARARKVRKQTDDEDEEDDDIVEIPQTCVSGVRTPVTTPKKASGSSAALSCPGTQTLKSGVSVWYPPALYAKKTTQSPAQSIFQDVSSFASEEDTSGLKGDASGWVVKVNSTTGRKFYFNTKTQTTTFRKPAGFIEPEDEEDGEEKKPEQKVARKEMFGFARRESPLPTGRQLRGVITKKRTFTKFVVPGESFEEQDEDVEMEDMSSSFYHDDEEQMEVDAVDVVRDLREHAAYSPEIIPSYRIPTVYAGDIGKKHESFDLVLDTNIFLKPEGGRFLVSFAMKELERLPPTRIRIPHVVFLELDRLKMRKGQQISEMAMQAVRFLNDCISELRDPRFVGQTAIEYSKGYPGFKPIMNDDRVLIYCLQIMAQHDTPHKVICVTDDLNLQNRGTVNNVRTISGARLYAEVAKCNRDQSSIFDEPRESVGTGFFERVKNTFGFSPGHASGSGVPDRGAGSSPSFPGFQGLSAQRVSSPVGLPGFQAPGGLPAVVCEEVRMSVEVVVSRLLAAVLECRLREVYDAHWRDIVKVQPPWNSLQIVLDLFQKHWMAVFGDMFTVEDKTAFSSLTVFLRANSSARGSEQVADHMLQHGSAAVAAVEELDARTRSPYEHLVHSGRLLLDRWRDMFDRARKGLQPVDTLANECAEFLRTNRPV